MKKGESHFVAKVRLDLERIGATVEKVADRYAMHRSDLSVCLKGLSFRIECKADEDAEYRAGQCLYIVQHARAGGLGFFAHPGNWADLFALMCAIPEQVDSPAQARLRRYSEVQMKALIQKKALKNPTQVQSLTNSDRDNKT
jgi:hypothetical protein